MIEFKSLIKLTFSNMEKVVRDEFYLNLRSQSGWKKLETDSSWSNSFHAPSIENAYKTIKFQIQAAKNFSGYQGEIEYSISLSVLPVLEGIM
jgi:hypothetical protein